MELFIDEGKNRVHIQELSSMHFLNFGTIEKCFGNAVDCLEKEFPEATGDNADFWVSDFLKGLSDGFSS